MRTRKACQGARLSAAPSTEPGSYWCSVDTRTGGREGASEPRPPAWHRTAPAKCCLAPQGVARWGRARDLQRAEARALRMPSQPASRTFRGEGTAATLTPRVAHGRRLVSLIPPGEARRGKGSGCAPGHLASVPCPIHSLLVWGGLASVGGAGSEAHFAASTPGLG